MQNSVILKEQFDDIVILTINRPQQLNALNAELLESISTHLNDLEKDDSVKSVILIGSGEKSFVAGADIKEFQDYNQEEGFELGKKGQTNVFDRLANFPKPTIAAVNGFALGGGLELAMACHIRICSANAMFGLPETNLGLIPGYGGTQRLPELVGKGHAFEMIFSAKFIDAKKAVSIGLVNASYTSISELIEAAKKMAKSFSKTGNYAKSKAIESVQMLGKEGAYDQEIINFGKCFGHDESTEGITAFLEKRKPNF